MSSARDSVSVFVLQGSLGKDEFAGYLRNLDAKLNAGQPFAMVVDGSDPELDVIEIPNSRWQLKRARAIGHLHRGIAFVAGTMTRERMRGLYALQPPGVPYGFFNGREEAIAWAQGALDREHKAQMSRRKTVPFMPAVGR